MERFSTLYPSIIPSLLIQNPGLSAFLYLFLPHLVINQQECQLFYFAYFWDHYFAGSFLCFESFWSPFVRHIQFKKQSSRDTLLIIQRIFVFYATTERKLLHRNKLYYFTNAVNVVPIFFGQDQGDLMGINGHKKGLSCRGKNLKHNGGSGTSIYFSFSDGLH